MSTSKYCFFTSRSHISSSAIASLRFEADGSSQGDGVLVDGAQGDGVLVGGGEGDGEGEVGLG